MTWVFFSFGTDVLVVSSAGPEISAGAADGHLVRLMSPQIEVRLMMFHHLVGATLRLVRRMLSHGR
jgi:hypothetical protein